MCKCMQITIGKTPQFCKRAFRDSEQRRVARLPIVFLLDREPPTSTVDDPDVHIHSRIRLIWVSKG